jgi:hypothetical protein
MNAKVARWTGSVVVLPLLLGSCLKTDEFPVEPILTFKSVEQVYEEVYDPADQTSAPQRFIYVTVGFTDGDGDIGLDAGDTLDPFGTGDAHNFNTRVVFERLTSGAWTDVQSESPGRIKRISPTGQDPTLNGEIRWKVGPYPGPRINLPSINTGDTMRVSMWLEDRALHRSNTVISGAFVLE